MNKKVSEIIAEFLKENQIKYAFGIIGSANSYIFDSINKLGYTKIIYVHHEQSAVMAMGAYFRASGKLSVALVTAGGGSSNATTGVVSNWADSIPGIIISGQEQSKYMINHKHLRMYGIQGFDSAEMVKKVTKYSKSILNANEIQDELEKSLTISINGRPGPVWLDIPFDVQSKEISVRNWNNIEKNNQFDGFNDELKKSVELIYSKLKSSKRPVIIAGHGVRISDSKNEFRCLVDKLNIPVILTWSGIDLLPELNPNNFGRSGIQGERCSNFIVQNSDLIITLGSRLTLLQTGYDTKDFATKAELIINDIDKEESLKHFRENTTVINLDTKCLINELLNTECNIELKTDWINYCKSMRKKYPKLMPEHNSNQYINCDGGLMMNLQELQTIKHHNLPIKIVIFNNDGYLMIKHTQKMLFNGVYNGVNTDSGLSLPNYEKLSLSFDFPYFSVKTWDDYETKIKSFLNCEGPSVCEVFMDPEQDFIPKVKGIKNVNGIIFAPPIEEMSPLLSFDEMQENMISGLNEKSKLIVR